MYEMIFLIEGIDNKSNVLSLYWFLYRPVLVCIFMYVCIFIKNCHLYSLQKNALDLKLR